MVWLKKLDEENENGTRKIIRKNYSTATQERLHKVKTMSWSTLGATNMYELVQVPEGESENEWIALNAYDFFNELHMLFEFVYNTDAYNAIKKPGDGFPPGFQYRIKDTTKKKPKLVTATEYVDQMLTWIESNIENSDIFPDDDEHTFPPDFISKYVKEIFVKMFRIFAILYATFLPTMKELDVAQHLNTSFKHYVYFALQYDILPEEDELTPLKKQLSPHLSGYKEEKEAFLAGKKLKV